PNATRVNGGRINGLTALGGGEEIRIGATCFRFRLAPTEPATDELPAAAEPARPAPPCPPPAEPEPDVCVADGSTTLQHDELTALFAFVDGSLREGTPQGLVGLALVTVHGQTGANVSGFLSLDEDDPLPRMVLPNLADV